MSFQEHLDFCSLAVVGPNVTPFLSPALPWLVVELLSVVSRLGAAEPGVPRLRGVPKEEVLKLDFLAAFPEAKRAWGDSCCCSFP